MRLIRRESNSAVHGSGRQAQDHLDPALLRDLFGFPDRLEHGVADVGAFQSQRGGAGVVPADLQQVVEQFFEALQLALQELHGAPAPPGCVLCEARSRAPHPAPPRMTPHESAPRWTGRIGLYSS